MSISNHLLPKHSTILPKIISLKKKIRSNNTNKKARKISRLAESMIGVSKPL